MLTVPESTSFRQEQDQRHKHMWRYSVIFTWQGSKGDDPWPKELPMTIGGTTKRYVLKED